MNLQENVIVIEDQREPKQRLNVKNSDISHSSFIDCTAVDTVFDDVSLTRVKVNYADLRDCAFTNINMVDGSISDANLTGLMIDGANISGMTIRNAGAHQPLRFDNLVIEGSAFNGCNLANAAFTNCNIEGLRVDGILLTDLLKLYREQ